MSLKFIDAGTHSMMDLELLCNTIENMDQKEFDRTIAKEWARAIKGLTLVYDNDVDKSKKMMILSAMAAAHVDGKFTQGEFRQVGSLIDNATGSNVTYEDTKDLIERIITDYNSEEELVQGVYRKLLKVDPDAAASYVIFLVFICCADGDACWKEKKWIKNIYE